MKSEFVLEQSNAFWTEYINSKYQQSYKTENKPNFNAISLCGERIDRERKKKTSSSDRSGKPIVQTAAIVKISNISRHLIQEGSSRNLHKISQPDANYLLLKIL